MRSSGEASPNIPLATEEDYGGQGGMEGRREGSAWWTGVERDYNGRLIVKKKEHAKYYTVYRGMSVRIKRQISTLTPCKH